jgi:hypothetical protein
VPREERDDIIRVIGFEALQRQALQVGEFVAEHQFYILVVIAVEAERMQRGREARKVLVYFQAIVRFEAIQAGAPFEAQSRKSLRIMVE